VVVVKKAAWLLALLVLLPGWTAVRADRTIAGNETVENGTLAEAGDIVVLGSLTVRNSTVTARSVVVMGELHALNSTIDAFLDVTGGTAELDGCTLAGHGVALTNATARLHSCNVSGSPADGVRISGGGGQELSGCNISGNFGGGVLLEGAASPRILNTTISGNGGDGLRSLGCSPEVGGCAILSNRGDGVHAENSLPGLSLDDCRIFGNGGWGLSAVRGAVDGGGCAFGDNALGRESMAWSLKVHVHGVDDSPKPGADVVVRDALGGLSGPVRTDAGGDAVFSSLAERRTDGGGNVTRYDPHALLVTLKGIVQGQNFTLDRNLVLDVMVDLPDLEVSRLQASSPVRIGQTVAISVDVTNTGASEAQNFVVAFYNGSHLIGAKVVAGLAPGASVGLSASWVPSGTGKEALRVKADPGNTIPEMNETNNQARITVEVEQTFGMQFAIPMILLIGVLGFAAFKLYQWIGFRRLTRKR
jgi:parallel beta-helix repeat protein